MKDKPLMLDNLDGYQFEELIAKIMKKRGYENVIVTQKSRDFGKDIIMEGHNKEIVIVECKHQKFVGRPIIQKLQGAMSHEEIQNSKQVKGIIVTSGSFSKEAINYNKEISQEIELIDGKKLNNLCKELNVVILNGKVQILTNESFINISKMETKELSNKCYSNIYWSKEHKPSIKTELKFKPACYMKYNINFNTHTSIGCIDNYSNFGEIIIDGQTGENLDKNVNNFFFSGRIDTEEIKEESEKIPFEFTENDIEEHAINSIINQHTHNVNYTGKNNVTYSKTCIPKRRDIDIKQFLPVYLPIWTNEVNVMKMNYKQEFYIKGNKQFYVINDLKKCKICEKEEENIQNLSICPECARITCHKHFKIDYFDKKTPICNIHAKPLKLWIQIKYFSKNENLKEYKELLESKNFFYKLYEDKIAFGLSLSAVCLFLIFLVSILK